MATRTLLSVDGVLNAGLAANYVGGVGPDPGDDVEVVGGSATIIGTVVCTNFRRRATHTGLLGLESDPLTITASAGVLIEGPVTARLSGALVAAKLLGSGEYTLIAGSLTSLEAGGRSTIIARTGFAFSSAPCDLGRSQLILEARSETVGQLRIGKGGRVETRRTFAGARFAGDLRVLGAADTTAECRSLGGTLDWRSTVLTPGAALVGEVAGLFDFSSAPGNVTLNSPVFGPNFPMPKSGPSNSVALTTPTMTGSREDLTV